jgi:hypothetical protein
MVIQSSQVSVMFHIYDSHEDKSDTRTDFVNIEFNKHTSLSFWDKIP